ncbi:MAG: nucleotidyltransferase domain-containing protein [Betaproteobacteria bacterium]|nr:nucleotidyltransferase domain-containing protein [Betaproteobacteria bacterium]
MPDDVVDRIEEVRSTLEYHASMNAAADLPLPGLRAEASRLGREVASVRLIVLFGSVARGRALPSSDVDIGIMGAEFWEGLRIGADLARLCGREPHVVELDVASELLRYEIARDGIALFEYEQDAWPRFRAEAIMRYFDFKPNLDLCVAGARRRLLTEARHG